METDQSEMNTLSNGKTRDLGEDGGVPVKTVLEEDQWVVSLYFKHRGMVACCCMLANSMPRKKALSEWVLFGKNSSQVVSTWDEHWLIDVNMRDVVRNSCFVKCMFPFFFACCLLWILTQKWCSNTQVCLWKFVELHFCTSLHAFHNNTKT